MSVHICDLPALPNLTKTGIDDFLAHPEGGPRKALALIDEAPHFTPPTVAEILAESEIASITEKSSSDEILACLRHLGNLLQGSEAATRESVRLDVIKHLKAMKVEGARNRVDAVLKSNDTLSNPSVLNATLQHSTTSPLSTNELEALHGCCRELSLERNILDRVADVMHQLCIAGEDRLIKLSYLVITARLLERPASLIIKGPSSVGKSYPVQMMMRLFPSAAYYALTGMSEHGLVYLTEPMAHRTLIIYEATGFESDEHSYFLRSLLSEGKLAYQTNEKGADGTIHPKLVVLEGPTGLITTTTAVNLHPENETRALSILANDSPEQTRAVMQAQAQEPTDLPDISPFVALQEWLTHAEHRVTVPFASQLANLIPPVAVRLRRDFPTILTLIKAHAILHQATRDKNGTGRIVANMEDYEAARDLVSDVIGSQVDATVSDTTRLTVEAVTRIHETTLKPVSISDLKRELKLDKSTISRRVKVALKLDYLQNDEKYRGRPYKLIPGDPLPARTDILPTAEVLHAVADRCRVDCNTYPSGAIEDTGKCCSVAAQTEATAQSQLHPSTRRFQERAAIAPVETPDSDLPEWMRQLSLKLLEIKKRRNAGQSAKPERRCAGSACYACRSTEQWRRDGGQWVCAVCHPPAEGLA